MRLQNPEEKILPLFYFLIFILAPRMKLHSCNKDQFSKNSVTMTRDGPVYNSSHVRRLWFSIDDI